MEGKMRRNILYIILSIITILCLFITAATCSFCGMQLDTGSSEETEEESSTATDKTDREETLQTEDQDRNDDEAESVEGAENHSPVITTVVADEVELDLSNEFRVLVEENINFLVIAQDDDSDELSYYASDSIENNMETVKMDNTAAGFGWVAPSEPGLYEIYITVSDGISEDAQATVHVTVNAMAEAHLLHTERLNIIGSRSGSICYDLDIGEATDTSGIIYAGDDEEHNIYKAYLCFNISSLTGLNISNAQLEIANIRKFGEPLDWATYLSFHSVDYGDLLETSDMDYWGATQVFAVRIDGFGESLVQTSDNLLYTIQQAIDDGRNWYQLSVGLGGAAVTDNDAEEDGYRLLLEGLVLQVSYFE